MVIFTREKKYVDVNVLILLVFKNVTFSHFIQTTQNGSEQFSRECSRS